MYHQVIWTLFLVVGLLFGVGVIYEARRGRTELCCSVCITGKTFFMVWRGMYK